MPAVTPKYHTKTEIDGAAQDPSPPIVQSRGGDDMPVASEASHFHLK